MLWRPALLILMLVIAACAGDARAEGSAVARDAGCFACHSQEDTDIAPTWVGLWGREVTLDDGSTIVADADYVQRSIEDPKAEIVSGYRDTMPLIPLTDEEKRLLVSYIRSIG